MAFATNDGVRIGYEVTGEGPPLVLMHGFTESRETWRETGYVDELAAEHQLILIDASGHGASDKPHEPTAYRGHALAADIVAVLDDIGVERTHFYGYSMGGRYAYLMARHAPTRLRTLLVGGVSPWRYRDRTEQFIALLEQGPDAFIALFAAQAPLPKSIEDRVRANDFAALLANLRSRLDDDDGIGDALQRLDRPYRLICGDLDEQAPYRDVVSFAEGLPPGSLITLRGINHLQGFLRHELVLPVLRALVAAER